MNFNKNLPSSNLQETTLLIRKFKKGFRRAKSVMPLSMRPMNSLLGMKSIKPKTPKKK